MESSQDGEEDDHTHLSIWQEFVVDWKWRKQEEPREETLEWARAISSTKSMRKKDKENELTIYTKWRWVPQLAMLVEVKT